MTSALPPALVIFSCADLENLCACTFTFFFSSPSPRILTSAPSFARPALTSDSSVPSASPSSAMRSRLRLVYSVRKILVKPRLGRRRWSGIWPPSKPRIIREPERERCPLCPRVEVLPMPDPIPRPTRFLVEFAFLGARRFERFITFSCCHSERSEESLLSPNVFGLVGIPHFVRNDRKQNYCTNSSRCGTFFTMPRIEGVSSRSTT